jgi:methionyl-tRNA formyltransferase
MIIKVLSSYNGEAKKLAEAVIKTSGHELYTDAHFSFDLIVAPDLEVILTPEQLAEPRMGALIFHPSPLPRMRGRNAIKRQYKAGDIIGGGTWFWANTGVDSGRIAEREMVIIDPSVRPSEYYNKAILPLMVRTLGSVLFKLQGGPGV